MSAPGAEVTRSAQPGDAAGAGSGQERHQDRGEDQQQAGASGQALKCPTQTKETMMNLFIKYFNLYLKLIVLS